MSDKALTTIIAIVFVFVLGLTVAFGISASSFWVGALAFIGVFLSLGSIGTLGTVEKVGFSFYITHALAVAAIAAAAWLADLQPLWMVIVLMSFSTISPIFASDYGFKQSKGEGYLAVLINLVSTPLAIALPALIMNASASTALAPQTWAWSLALAGLAVLSVGLLQAGMQETSPYFVCLPIGLVPLIGSAFLIHFELNWLWLLPWIAAAILIGVGGSLIPRWRTKSGTFGIVLAVLVLLIGVGLSLMNYGVLPNLFRQETPQTVAQATIEGTLSAADQAATQLAAAAATATQAILDEQLALTQTQQALAAAQQQTAAAAISSTPTPKPTPTFAPTKTAVSVTSAAGETQAAVEGPGFFKAIGAFLWFTIKSIKGIAYLILLFGIGQAWIKRWGGGIILLILLLAVGIFGGANLVTLNTMTNIATTGPTAWWTYVLMASLNWTGTMGWGIMAFVLLISVLLLPAIKFSSQLSQQALSTQGGQNIGMSDYGCRESLATLVYLVMSSAIPITLWIALHRFATASVGKFPFLFIPNLTVPNWKPVWHYSYFVLGGIFLLAYFLYLRLLRKSQPNNVFTQFGIWGALPVTVVLTLLAPAGVVLYLTVQMIFMVILQPIFALPQKKVHHAPQPFHTPSPVRPPEPSPEEKAQAAFDLYLDEIKKKAEEQQREEEHQKRIEEERKKRLEEERKRKAMETRPEDDLDQTHDEEEEERRKAMETRPEEDLGKTTGDLESEPLCTLSTPMVGGYLKVANWLAVLDMNGSLFWLINGTRHGEVDLPLESPLALLSGLDDQLLAVGTGRESYPNHSLAEVRGLFPNRSRNRHTSRHGEQLWNTPGLCARRISSHRSRLICWRTTRSTFP